MKVDKGERERERERESERERERIMKGFQKEQTQIKKKNTEKTTARQK